MNPYNYKIQYYGRSKILHRIIDKLNHLTEAVLGTTHDTAYYGDQGEAAYQHSLLKEGNPHRVSLADLGVPNLVKQIDAIQDAIGLEITEWAFHGEVDNTPIQVIDHEGNQLIFQTFRDLLTWH